MLRKLPGSFYLQDDVVKIAKQLIGKILVTNINNRITKGRITETEAYCGLTDRACHAYKGKTKRTEIMFEEGGFAYVYLCYGIHHLFNITTNVKGRADAVLVRSVEPLQGIDFMQERRDHVKLNSRLSSGPGNAAKAMGISLNQNHHRLVGEEIWLEDAQDYTEDKLGVAKRIGVEYAGEDALLPWRFYDLKSEFVSKR